jgi:hypothetical protein
MNGRAFFVVNTRQFRESSIFQRNILPSSSRSKTEPSNKPEEVGGSLSLVPTSASFLLGSLFNPEEGNDMFL